MSYFSAQIWVINSSRNSRNSSEIARNSSRVLFLGFPLQSPREIAEIANNGIPGAIPVTSENQQQKNGDGTVDSWNKTERGHAQ